MLPGLDLPESLPQAKNMQDVQEADEGPVAQVIVDSSLPHLDRLFDYRIPAELDAQAQPGVRVKVRFGGQELSGYLVSRGEASASGRRLKPISRVLGELPVLAPEILDCARAVAERYAGTVSDVLRVAVPPRVARVEKDLAVPAAETQEPAPEKSPETATEAGSPLGTAFAGYPRAAAFLDRLAAGESPRAALLSARGYGPEAWHRQLAEAIAACYLSGRGVIAVVPDQRDLELLCASVVEALGPESFVRLTAEDGPSARYRAFLRLVTGERRIALGNRSAAFAPVQDLGLLCCWDDGDDVLLERRAPYQHAREVLLIRAQQQSAALLFAGYARTTEVQRLVERQWVQPIELSRSELRMLTPRVLSTSDSYELGADPAAASARLPHRAWLTAQQALASGPVLVQVARAGYFPALFCQQCREPTRCRECAGPLGQLSPAEPLSCRWCGTPEYAFRCASCGSAQLRRGAAGAGRTAEELGRAFPKTSVITSSGDHVKDSVPDRPALVVATVGAEPVAAEGYAAALLLDGDRLLSRENLRTGEETLRRWLAAAALVRPRGAGGIVVCVAADVAASAALVRWDPAGFAERELAQRIELGLPPAARVLALTGPLASVRGFTERLSLPDEVRVIGPALVDERGGLYRTLLFIPYQQAAAVLVGARAARASSAAARLGEPVQLRCDGVDVL